MKEWAPAISPFAFRELSRSAELWRMGGRNKILGTMKANSEILFCFVRRWWHCCCSWFDLSRTGYELTWNEAVIVADRIMGKRLLKYSEEGQDAFLCYFRNARLHFDLVAVACCLLSRIIFSLSQQQQQQRFKMRFRALRSLHKPPHTLITWNSPHKTKLNHLIALSFIQHSSNHTQQITPRRKMQARFSSYTIRWTSRYARIGHTSMSFVEPPKPRQKYVTNTKLN